MTKPDFYIVKDTDGKLIRDANSKAILNLDLTARQKYLEAKKLRQSQEQKIESLQERIDKLESLVRQLIDQEKK